MSVTNKIKSDTYISGKTLHPELVGKVTGNTNVFFYGNKTQSPQIWGDIFGGGSLAIVEGDARVNIYAGNFAGEIFGGGKGLLYSDGTVQNSADILGNTFVSLAQDQGGQEEGENGKPQDNFSINVIWDEKWEWDATTKKIMKKTWEENKESFYDGNKVTPVEVFCGEKVSAEDIPEIENPETFGGWFLNEEFTEPFTLELQIKEDTSVFAKRAEVENIQGE